MGKTADLMLAKALANPSGRVGVDFGHDRGRAFGSRALNACNALVRAGRFERIEAGADSGTNLYKPGWGVSGRVYTAIFKLVK